MTSTDVLFVAFVKNLEDNINEEDSITQQCADCLAVLQKQGFLVWSVPEAVVSITASPESDLAAELVGGLEYFFFYKKIERWTTEKQQK